MQQQQQMQTVIPMRREVTDTDEHQHVLPYLPKTEQELLIATKRFLTWECQSCLHMHLAGLTLHMGAIWGNEAEHQDVQVGLLS